MNAHAPAPGGPADPAPDATVIIVSYRTRDLTLAAIRSAIATTRRHALEVIVADNASDDGSADAVEEAFGTRVRLLRLDRNIGFGPANNAAATHARGRWILLLNPDTVVLDDAIDTLLDAADAEPERGVFGGRTLFADGRLNPTNAWREPSPISMLLRGTGLSALFPSSPSLNPETMPHWDRSTSRDVDIVSGCYLLIHAELWRRLGGFDERFALYAEEFDLCRRARHLGARPRIIAGSSIIHLGGRSETVREDQTVRQFAARVMYARKHWRPALRWIAPFSLDLWAAGKLAREHLRSAVGRPSAADTWSRIWRRRAEWHHPSTEHHLAPRRAGVRPAAASPPASSHP